MELKLDELGRLYIKRLNSWIGVQCQHKDGACSDRCAKFQEPYYNNGVGGNEGGCIDLCNGDSLSFTELYDERVDRNMDFGELIHEVIQKNSKTLL